MPFPNILKIWCKQREKNYISKCSNGSVSTIDIYVIDDKELFSQYMISFMNSNRKINVWLYGFSQSLNSSSLSSMV